ncbi:hypothetical protein BIV57_19135 [Mangrovactinospora gilvigrisea]|uniref:Uncharacterized protein n=1 Tax=Mangrovactinospora gilvigrisea TaxID=1428644 RepID=A0A1J7C2X0_9ACTN|nr:hypothetical protein [Mangrovactinospora gilvigrisea]OIV35912.1 hypothetical protein BIV57_19135 [Mangrovactinospora gilvigrisea]
MALNEIPWSEFRPNRNLLTAGAIVGAAGALTAAAGACLMAYEVTRAGRAWFAGWEVPPAERANRTLDQARHAARAGREAWLSHSR